MNLEAFAKNINKNLNRKTIEKTLGEWRFPLEAGARTALYFIPALSTAAFLGRSFDPRFKKYKETFSLWDYLKQVKHLYEQDAENIRAGYYMAPEHFLPHLKDYALLNIKNTLDLFKVKDRIQKNDVHVLDKQMSPDEFPDYYRQSFHFQSDGYLSSESAELYDHQVELVFSGTAEAMRRHGLKALALQRATKYPNDEKLRVLDIGCGTGAFTYELKRHFPMSDVSGVDLSPWYLKEAQRRHPRAGINWTFGAAEKLPFEDHSFDIVSSVFLFHELPDRIRSKAAQEMFRVLKPGGSLVHIDSLQLGDVPELDVSLEIFPHLYHEPYYQNYIKQKTEKKFEAIGLKNLASEHAFYSKIVSGEKPYEN